MGAGMLRRELSKEGVEVGRRQIGTLMRWMNIHALAPRPGTSKSCPEHTVIAIEILCIQSLRPMAKVEC